MLVDRITGLENMLVQVETYATFIASVMEHRAKSWEACSYRSTPDELNALVDHPTEKDVAGRPKKFPRTLVRNRLGEFLRYLSTEIAGKYCGIELLYNANDPRGNTDLIFLGRGELQRLIPDMIEACDYEEYLRNVPMTSDEFDEMVADVYTPEFQEGRSAHDSDVSVNPYSRKRATKRYDDWNRGWNETQDEIEESEGG